MSAFRIYTELLRRLHQLIAEGAGDSEAADVIRDDMTTPWTQMTREEVEAANQLSAEFAKAYEVAKQ